GPRHPGGRHLRRGGLGALREPPHDRDAPAPDLPQGGRALPQRDDAPAGPARRGLAVFENFRVFPDAPSSATRDYALVRRGKQEVEQGGSTEPKSIGGEQKRDP